MPRSNKRTKAPSSLSILASQHRRLLERLDEYVKKNADALKLAADGVDGYGFVLQQLDELFLMRLNMLERTTAELSRLASTSPNAQYRVLCFEAKTKRLEEAINERLEDLADAKVTSVSSTPLTQTTPDDSAKVLVTILYFGAT